MDYSKVCSDGSCVDLEPGVEIRVVVGRVHVDVPAGDVMWSSEFHLSLIQRSMWIQKRMSENKK